MPGAEFGEITAERRTDGRCQRCHKTDHRRNDVEFLTRENQISRRENRRDHAATEKSLQGTVDDHFLDRGGSGAHQAHHRETGR